METRGRIVITRHKPAIVLNVPRLVSLTIISRDNGGGIIPPRTKKNSPQIIRHMKHPVLLPSKNYLLWERGAKAEMLRSGECTNTPDGLAWHYRPIDYPLNCRALIYRDRAVGDAVGFYQAVADFLELMRVVENDKWIVSWNGSELMKDVVLPRVEVELYARKPLCEVQMALAAGARL